MASETPDTLEARVRLQTELDKLNKIRFGKGTVAWAAEKRAQEIIGILGKMQTQIHSDEVTRQARDRLIAAERTRAAESDGRRMRRDRSGDALHEQRVAASKASGNYAPSKNRG